MKRKSAVSGPISPFPQSLVRNEWKVQAVKLLVPVSMFCLYFLIIYRLTQTATEIAPLMLAYSLPPLGKESVIPTAMALGLSPTMLFLLIVYIDLSFALLILWNYDLLHNIPLWGRVLKKIETAGMTIWNRHQSLDRLAFVGLVLFVFIPFHGTGATTSALLGRMIGIDPLKSFFAIMTGSITGVLFVMFFSDAIMELLGRGSLLLLAVVTIGVLCFLFVRKNLENVCTHRKL